MRDAVHRLPRCSKTITAAAVILLAGSAFADIHLTTGTIPAARLTPAQVKATVNALAGSEQGKHIIVQFNGVLSTKDRQALEKAGVKLTNYIGDNSFIAILDKTDAKAVSAVGAIRSMVEFNASYKEHEWLQTGNIPDYAIVDNSNPDNPRVALYVMLHQDANLNRGKSLVEDLGGEIISTLKSNNTLVVHLDKNAIDQLAGNDEIMYIEPPLPKFDVLNDSNRARVQADQVQGAPYNLDGSGVTVLVYDGGTVRSTHVDFQGRAFVRDSSGMHYHSTHVAGTIGGAGVANPAYKGMAPGVTIQSYGFEQAGGLHQGFLYTDPGDLESDYDEAINVYGSDISNNSIGTNTAWNGFPCEWEGNYGVTANLIDSIVGGSLGDPFRIVWANGNERGGACGSLYHTTAPPACGKNHITVGALNSNDDSMTGFSSWGPTDDGRIKPDVSAPGCQSNGDGGVTSCDSSSNTAYTTLCGTSMASPTTCGVGALLLQDYRDHYPGQPDFRNSTLKMLLAHTAADNGNAGPDYQFGYGSIRAKEAVDFMRSGNFTEQELSQGAVFGFNMDVAAGDPEVKVTIAWDDVPAVPLSTTTLVNDIDIVVFDPSGGRHYPWTLNPANPSSPAVQTQEDHLNNIEQVYVANPQAGTWRVEIVGTNIPVGSQVVSIGATPSLTVQGVFISLNSPIPENVDPMTPVETTIEVNAIEETLIPNSVMLHYRTNGGSFTSVQMMSAGADLYTATLPGVLCEETPEFYFSAEGSVSGVVTNPGNAPASVYTYDIGHTEVITTYEMEVDDGWTVGAPDDDATTGIWNRMDPEATEAQPEDDHTPAPGVNCWVTDGRAGSGLGTYDVDNGKTTLYSPVMDLTGQADATVSYWRWYSNNTGADPNNDVFVVDISNDGGNNWTNVETVGPSGAGTSGGWIYHEFRLGDIVANPSSQVKMRFIASDEASGSIVEAAIDDFSVQAFVCENPSNCPGDLNGDGQRNQEDLGILLSAYLNSDAGDIDGDGDTDQADLGALLSVYNVPCP